MVQRVVITVDGLAGSGKTALSKALAERLGYAHFNSGLTYRIVGYLCLREGVDVDNEAAIVAVLNSHAVSLAANDSNETFVAIDGEAVPLVDLQVPEVSEASSKISRFAGVRNALFHMQRGAFAEQSMIAEGRDMGTVVFPEAQAKFFIQADVSVRLERRMQQLASTQSCGSQDEDNLLKSQMKKEIIERDERDTSRSVAPTVPASDAVIVNNNGETLTQVVDSMYHSLANKGLV